MASGSILSDILMKSFTNWGVKDKKYKKTFNKLHDSSLEIAKIAFIELQDPKPGTYNWWWANNERRFTSVKNEQQRLVHELVHEFLKRYVRGTLQDEDFEKPKRASGKSKRRSSEAIGEWQ